MKNGTVMLRRPVARALVAVAALGAALLPLAPPAGAHTPATCAVSAADAAIEAHEQQLLTLVNQYRQANGLNALFLQHDVVRASSWLSRDMATNNYMDHTDTNGRWIDARLTWCAVPHNNFGENVYAGFGGAETAQAAFDWWKGSPPHNANLLRQGVTAAGIARAYNPNATFKYYWTLNVTDTSVFNLAVGDVRITEGSGGSRTANFPVTLSNPSPTTVSVAYATANATAVQPGDYTARTGTLSFAPGVVSAMVAVSVKADTLDEANETFQLRLSSASGAAITDGTGVATIVDDDPSSGLRLYAGDVTIYEGDSGNRTARMSVTLSGAAATTVTVNYATANGSAAQPSDYAAKTGTLTFNPGVTTRFVDVVVKGDVNPEANETVVVNLSGPTRGATVGDGSGVVTIRSDD